MTKGLILCTSMRKSINVMKAYKGPEKSVSIFPLPPPLPHLPPPPHLRPQTRFSRDVFSFSTYNVGVRFINLVVITELSSLRIAYTAFL